MKHVAALTAIALAAIFATSAAATSKGQTLKGAGSTFVSPLVLTWVQPYESATGVHVDYNPVGSGGGIAAITNRSVDFGASDAPLTPDQFNACNGCVQIPWTASGTSIAYNLSGAPPHLKITGKVLANIYLGKVKKWNDPALKRLNPGVTLPGTDITPIFRSDASGTTYNVTDYLSKVSPEWKSKVGMGTQVNFPAGGVGGRGSSGVSAVLSRTNGGIIYVDVAFATKNHFSFFSVKNKGGKYQLPGTRQIKAAMDTVKHVNPDNKISIVDPKGAPLAYPISTFTYVILPTKSDNASALRKYVFWGMTNGVKKFGPPLRFLQVPPVVLSASEKTLKKVQS